MRRHHSRRRSRRSDQRAAERQRERRRERAVLVQRLRHELALMRARRANQQRDYDAVGARMTTCAAAGLEVEVLALARAAGFHFVQRAMAALRARELEQQLRDLGVRPAADFDLLMQRAARCGGGT